MKRVKHFLFLSVLLLLIFYEGSIAQQLPQPEEFLIGTFIHSMHPPYKEYVLFNNYEQILDCGFNSVFQYSKKPIESNNSTNLDLLSQFPYLFAANDSGTGSLDEHFNAEQDNIDWISYFTQAKYRKWEAEGDPLFQGNVRIKHADNDTFGEEYSEENGNISGWKSGINPVNEGKLLVTGPDYWQWPKYTYTNPGWNDNPITYKAVFRMKIDYPSEIELPVCQIMVTNTDKNGIETYLHLPEFPEFMTLTTDDLSTEYQNFEIEYNYIGYFDLPQGDPNYPSFPTLVTQPFDEIEYSPGFNAGSEVQFKVKWLGNKELFVDYIEVYDERVWEARFKGFQNYQFTVNTIMTYDQYFKNSDINFYNNLKYYGTLDEPQVIDCYEPLRKVQFLLDSLQIQADLLTHWYPGWDFTRDGDNTWKQYSQLAQPKKVMFWYSPFTNDITNSYTPSSRDFTLYWLHNNLQQAHLQQPRFYITLQTWGTKNLNSGEYESYMYPTPEEISAETMLSLAHGVTGIFYETYYSFYQNDEYSTVNEALVNLPVGNPPSVTITPTDRWYKVQQLAERLNGTLGKTLMTLNYTATDETNGFLMLRRNVHEPTGASESLNYLTLSTNTEDQPINFHAGFFTNSSQPSSNYFLLTNQIVTENRTVNIEVTDNFAGVNNMRFRNIEPDNNFDITFTGSYSTDYDFPAGEGYLFQVAPVAIYGGKLIYDEYVNTDITLYDDMTIENGATLTLDANYYCKGNITIKDGGSIKTVNGATIQFESGKKLIMEGLATVKGTSTHKLTLDFNDPNDNTGIEVLTDGDFTASKKLMLLK